MCHVSNIYTYTSTWTNWTYLVKFLVERRIFCTFCLEHFFLLAVFIDDFDVTKWSESASGNLTNHYSTNSTDFKDIVYQNAKWLCSYIFRLRFFEQV